MKKIHIILSEKDFNELKEIKLDVEKDMPEFLKSKHRLPDTYKEYVEQEKKKPTMALFG